MSMTSSIDEETTEKFQIVPFLENSGILENFHAQINIFSPLRQEAA